MVLTHVYKNIHQEIRHSWDSQWSYARLKSGGLGIVPCRNLIHNIGDGGTHTNTIDPLIAEEMPENIRHPRFIVPNYEYENYHFYHHISSRIGAQKRIIQFYLRI